MRAAVIETYELTRRFGDVVAVAGVSFTVRVGEIFGLIGPNGAGKSTLEKYLMTVEAAWQVTVTRHDGSVHHYTERRGRHPEIGEVIEVRDAIGPPLIARVHAVHRDPQAPGALAKWNVAAIEIGQ